MKARLSIYTDKEIGLYYNAICDLNVKNERATINFKYTGETSWVYSIGVNPGKIFIMRAIDCGAGVQPEDTEIYVISDESAFTKRSIVEFSSVKFFLKADGLITDISEEMVKVSIRCFINYDDEQVTDECTINIVCQP